jgi:response regulator RpfG family c-di-GMP phosphodiesterase
VHEYLRNMAGNQFDPQLVAKFMRYLDDVNG